MLRTRTKTLSLLGLGLAAALALAARPAPAQTADVLKSHNDFANTGQNLQETLLTPALLRSGRFGLLFRIPVDPDVGPNIPHNLSGAEIYAQPLYLAGMPLPGGGRRNVLFVATEHDSVYAFDADTGAMLWKRTDFVDGQTRRPFRGNSDLQPEIGITGTPVIDPATGTLYVVVADDGQRRGDAGRFSPAPVRARLRDRRQQVRARLSGGDHRDLDGHRRAARDRPDHVPPGPGEPALRAGPERAARSMSRGPPTRTRGLTTAG